ncbi:MAG TPA: response regulator transcription factor [Dehalococcoidia bacterium]|nr:response regulator transcription factor [Dehalococcoidia bacterium]
MKVLVVEDDPGIIESVSLCFELRWPGANLVSSSAGEKGVELAGTEFPDVIILDLGLPDMDGLEVLRQIRRFSDVPVVILTARGEEMDKVKGLELGADDYITKPFAPAEFLARIKTVLRRSQRTEPKAGEKPVVRGKLKIDFATREVSLGDRLIKLTPSEYNLLCELVRNEGRVLSNQMLLERVWGPEYTTETEYIKVYIQRLREKLEEEAGNPKMILSERGVGYKFVGHG